MTTQQRSWTDFISMGFGRQKIYDENMILFRQGEVGHGFYYVSAGEVKISLLSNEGHERDIDYVTPGKLVGEQGFNNNVYFTTAQLTMPSILYFFSDEDFNELCLEAPEAIHLFTTSLLLKVRLLAESTALLNAPAEYRLAHFLYKQFIAQNKDVIQINQASLARFVGTSRVTIHKIMKQWTIDGMIEYNKGSIHLLNHQKLENLSKNLPANSIAQLSDHERE